MLGTMAALPATVVINWLPNSEATVGGGVLFVGPLIAGAIAVKRSVEPGAAGLRGGVLGGVIAVAVFLFTEGPTIAWSLNMTVFFLIAVVMILCLSPMCGLISGRIGGWIADAVVGSSVDQPA